jgi:hypothetical protein
MNYADPEDVAAFPEKSIRVQCSIRDARAMESPALTADPLLKRLDSQGFCLSTCPAAAGLNPEVLQDPERVSKDYYPIMMNFLRQEIGAPLVMPLNHVLRKSGTSSAIPAGKTQDVPKSGEFTGAIANVHADITDESKAVVLCRTVQQWPWLQGGRFMILNCWQPLRRVECWPLAVCDADSVDADDLVPRYTEGNANWVYNSVPCGDKHRWFYYPDMHAHEMLLFKSWDEDPTMSSSNKRGPHGVARQTLHSSFKDPTSSPNAPVRMSLEMRFVCFWPAAHDLDRSNICTLTSTMAVLGGNALAKSKL